MKQTLYNFYKYIYLIVLVSSVIVYAFNSSDHKEGAKFCAGHFEDVSNLYINLMYWKDDGVCCHYILDETDNIAQECQ